MTVTGGFSLAAIRNNTECKAPISSFFLLQHPFLRHHILTLLMSCISQFVFEHKATVIQRCVRGWLVRQRYRRTLAAVILLQSCVRRCRAKKELRRLKAEARSVEHFKKLNVGMENKIMQLQHKINEQVSMYI